MTEYGRSSGSAPWHPEDQPYGNDGRGRPEAHAAQSSSGGWPLHHPEQSQQHHGDWQGHPQAYGQRQQDCHQGGNQGGQEYPQPHGQQYPAPGPQDGQQSPGQERQDQGHGGWDGGGQPHVACPAGPVDPYGAQAGAYGGEQPDLYRTPDALSPPEPPNRRRAEPQPKTDWNPGPGEGEHAFRADADDVVDDGSDAGRERRGRGGKSAKGKKRRNGRTLLIVVLVLVGGFGTVGYFGYQYFQNRFAPAPDYVGEGNSEQATVTIPKGADGYTIGRVLKEAGVVKSVDAFVAAQQHNPSGKSIQAGTYTLKTHMSAKAAVQLMLSPKSKNNLIIAEGWRNARIYAAIDDRLKLSPGTTMAIAKKQWPALGLPDWAGTTKDIKDPLEGFLYPSAYPIAKGAKPEDVLKLMVDMAKQKYAALGIQAEAEGLNLQNPLQVLTVASLVQAEGKYKHDFEKVARVVYNRLKPYPENTQTAGRLEFDSTVNYLRGESKLATGSVNALRQIDDPYNTYKIRGLPPGPIDNPGQVAIEAALNPARGNWYYFVSINESETLFAETNEEQNRNRRNYFEAQQKGQ